MVSVAGLHWGLAYSGPVGSFASASQMILTILSQGDLYSYERSSPQGNP